MKLATYDALSDEEKFFADLLLEIISQLKGLQTDIRDDLEATLRKT